ncbi:MAG: cyd operon protein YbgT [Alphaproteobacteria bacterium 16-39-46]|nr:MAG: cyd operon protein YbgT [Alphaproteobacteria bacterium 16-39-46]OZA41641.1 MAG: cyd operon protein YbgT [Alphaproteobacteria bacterium 17-39-52]HQS84761.1 cytochrome bd-I oxidase subunit CydX [Alphaproteobacteria bacterium]HQS94573.1 cytochrome bd-I oxidase subunit CydX [Alphaproteobacteria bacterium]
MWYFVWALGLGLACTFAILNALWYERQNQRKQKEV